MGLRAVPKMTKADTEALLGNGSAAFVSGVLISSFRKVENKESILIREEP